VRWIFSRLRLCGAGYCVMRASAALSPGPVLNLLRRLQTWRECSIALAASAARFRSIASALLGAWRYDIRAQAWGWDAAARDDTAAMAAAPSAKDKLGVPAAYWLAWESIPLWQMVNGHTVGHARRSWSYPICGEWLSWEGLKALVLGRERMTDRELAAQGVRTWTAPILDTNSTGGKELGLAVAA